MQPRVPPHGWLVLVGDLGLGQVRLALKSLLRFLNFLLKDASGDHGRHSGQRTQVVRTETRWSEGPTPVRTAVTLAVGPPDSRSWAGGRVFGRLSLFLLFNLYVGSLSDPLPAAKELFQRLRLLGLLAFSQEVYGF